VSPSFLCGYTGIYEAWSILAPRSPSLANHRSAWHIPIRRSLNLVVLQWDLLGNATMLLKIVDRLAAFRQRLGSSLGKISVVAMDRRNSTVEEARAKG